MYIHTGARTFRLVVVTTRCFSPMHHVSVLEMLLPTTALAAHLEDGTGTSAVALTSDLLSASNSQSQYLPLPPADTVQVSTVQVREYTELWDWEYALGRQINAELD